MEAQQIHTWYDIAKDFSGPLMTLLQNIILLATAYFAVRAIKSNTDNSNNQIENQNLVARKRSTLDLILHMIGDPDYNTARSVVIMMKNENINPAHLIARAKDMSLTEDERKIAAERHRAAQYVLNKMSLFAAGIRNGVLDEVTFQQYYYSTYMVMTDFLRGYIIETREVALQQSQKMNYISHETIYQEVIWLMNKWKSQPLDRINGGSV